MTHLSVEQIDSYVAAQAPALDAHLASCAQCRRELSAERRIAQALRHLERVAPSPEFAARLDRALERVASVRVRPTHVDRPSFAWTGIAALLASFLLAVFAYQTLVGFQEGARSTLFPSTPVAPTCSRCIRQSP